VTWCFRSAEPDAGMAHLCPTIGAFSDRCNSGHRLAESRGGAVQPECCVHVTEGTERCFDFGFARIWACHRLSDELIGQLDSRADDRISLTPFAPWSAWDRPTPYI
jgi:hypothetical protein